MIEPQESQANKFYYPQSSLYSSTTTLSDLIINVNSSEDESCYKYLYDNMGKTVTTYQVATTIYRLLNDVVKYQNASALTTYIGVVTDDKTFDNYEPKTLRVPEFDSLKPMTLVDIVMLLLPLINDRATISTIMRLII